MMQYTMYSIVYIDYVFFVENIKSVVVVNETLQI